MFSCKFKKNINKMLVIFLVFTIIQPFLQPPQAKASVEVKYSLHGTYYDVWRNAAGDWIDASGSIRRPGQTGNHTFNSSVPSALEGYRLVNVISIDLGHYNDSRVMEALNQGVRSNLQNRARYTAVNNTVTGFSATGGNIRINANITTLPEGYGDNQTKEWQGENVLGERTYFFYLSKWEREAPKGTINIHYFDTQGNSISSQDIMSNLELNRSYTVSNKSISGYNFVESGYSSSPGGADPGTRQPSSSRSINLSSSNPVVYVYFYYERQQGNVYPIPNFTTKGEVKPNENIGYNDISIIPSGVTVNNRNFEIFDNDGRSVKNYNYVNISGQPSNITLNSGVYTGTLTLDTNVGEFDITKTIRVASSGRDPDPDSNAQAGARLRASWFRNILDSDSVVSDSVEGRTPTLEVPLNQPVRLDGYAFNLDNNRDISSEIEEWFWNAGGTHFNSRDITVSDSEVGIWAVRLYVKYKGRWSEYASAALRFIEKEPGGGEDPKLPPSTKITGPDIYYPKALTDTGDYENKITWSYSHPEDEPMTSTSYKLYKLVYDELELVDSGTRNGSDASLRELVVEGNSGELFELEVEVTAENGETGKAFTNFVIENWLPEITLTIDTSRERENILGVNVENITPAETEALFPTSYTRWEIRNTDGNILEEGEGKFPEWIEIDDRYYGNVSTFIQYAKSEVGDAEAQDRYSSNSKIDFKINPSRLFETEYATIEDLSKVITGHKWSIRNVREPDYSPLFLEDMKFTQEYGEYQVRLVGDGRVAGSGSLYRYAENETELTRAVLEPTSAELQELAGKDARYVWRTAEWDGGIEDGPFEYEGNSYPYRRQISFLMITAQEMNAIRDVEFLDTKPKAGFVVGGNKKQYKKVILDGRVSIDATNSELQAKYPIQFDSPLTRFQVIGLDESREFDYSKNDYIYGIEKEIVDDIVTFRAKDIQEIRFDEPGWYHIRYKVYNGKKESDWFGEDIYISPELPITTDMAIEEFTVYRSPSNDLKAELNIKVVYNSPDDEIDADKSKLIIEYNEQGEFGEEIDQSYWISNNDCNLPEFLEEGEIQFNEKQGIFKIYADNSTKNLFGYFRLNFIAIEKPLIPNFEESSFPEIPVIYADTFDIADEEKVIKIDNIKPVIDIETGKENTIEIWILEEADRQINVEYILEQLDINRVNAVINVIRQDGTVETLTNN